MSRGLTRLVSGGVGALLWLTLGCTGEKVPVFTAEETASRTAKAYYEALYNGNPELFLNGRSGVATMTQDYREQLLTAYRQHVSQVMSEHRGVRSVDISHASMDSTLQVMQVFLVLSYNDGTQEEIVTAMVDDGHGQWQLK